MTLLRNKYALIIFDWDGTVVDSISTIVAGLKGAATELQLPVLDDSVYKSVIGLSMMPAARTLYPDLSDSGISEYIEGYRKHFRSFEQQAPKTFSGALSGVQWLQEQGVALAVATGKSRAGLQRSMAANGFGSEFDLCKTSDDARSKPDPDMLEQILRELDVPAAQALMVGDSCLDMQMAQSAGVDRVAVSYGAQSVAELERYDPSYIADSFTGLTGWLDGVSEVD